MPGAVLGNEGFAFGAKPGVMRLCLSRKNTWADIREQTTLASLFSLGSYAIVVLLKSPEKGACKTSGVLQRSGKGRLGLQAEKGPFLSLSCQGKRGCEQRAHPSQFLSGGRWCRRFSCPGSAARQHASAVPFVPSSRAYAVFPGMRLSGQHSDGFEEPWVSRLPVSG